MRLLRLLVVGSVVSTIVLADTMEIKLDSNGKLRRP